MLLLAATDPAVERLLEKVGELWARVASVEQKFHDLRAGAETFAWAVGIVGISAIGVMILWVRSLIIKKVADRVEQSVASELKKSAIPKLEAEAKKALEASGAIVTELRGLADNVANQWIIDTGEHQVTFNAGYLQVEEHFSIRFPTTPQVLVCESDAGAWVFVKVDSKGPDKFTWAATILGSSRPLPYTTRIQWVAIARKTAPLDAKEPKDVEVSNPPARMSEKTPVSVQKPDDRATVESAKPDGPAVAGESAATI